MTMVYLLAAGLILIVFLALVAWRTGGRYGKLVPSGEAAAAYERFRVAPDRAYYTSGSDLYPSALIGIDQSWTLQNDLWRKRDLDTRTMKELVENMRRRSLESGGMPHGFDILDHRGQTIGDCYAALSTAIPVRITGERTVVMDTPPPDPPCP